MRKHRMFVVALVAAAGLVVALAGSGGETKTLAQAAQTQPDTLDACLASLKSTLGVETLTQTDANALRWDEDPAKRLALVQYLSCIEPRYLNGFQLLVGLAGDSDSAVRADAVAGLRRYQLFEGGERRELECAGPEAEAAGMELELVRVTSASRFSDEFVQDLPVPGRFYQNVLTLAPGVNDPDGDGNPTVHGSRSADFKAVVGGVSNVDPLTGQFMSMVNSDSVEEIEVVTGGAGVEFGRAQGGFARIVQSHGSRSRDYKRRERLTPAPVDSSWGLTTKVHPAFEDNPFRSVIDHPLDTRSANVDTASLGLVRMEFGWGNWPDSGEVRVEELINAFTIDVPEPSGAHPIGISSEVFSCPWSENICTWVVLKAAEDQSELAKPLNFVFLLDTSGSMGSIDRLDLLKASMRELARSLRPKDTVSIVAFRHEVYDVLPPTSGSEIGTIIEAIDSVAADGSTAGAAGLERAYEVARENFIHGAHNRVVMGTDGDFNVGETHRTNLVKLIKQRAKNDIYLTVLGFGNDNFRDERLLTVSNWANGNYHYIDSLPQGRKVLVSNRGTFVPVANDVKIQVEFNPEAVQSYRLHGYEIRELAPEDFNDDRKDAGEMGAGHTVSYLYEIVPIDRAERKTAPVDELRYQTKREQRTAGNSDELMWVKVRYKNPGETNSHLLTVPVQNDSHPATSPDAKFIAAVAGFGSILRNPESPTIGDFTLQDVLELSLEGLGPDHSGERTEFYNGVVLQAMNHANYAACSR